MADEQKDDTKGLPFEEVFGIDPNKLRRKVQEDRKRAEDLHERFLKANFFSKEWERVKLPVITIIDESVDPNVVRTMGLSAVQCYSLGFKKEGGKAKIISEDGKTIDVVVWNAGGQWKTKDEEERNVKLSQGALEELECKPGDVILITEVEPFNFKRVKGRNS